MDLDECSEAELKQELQRRADNLAEQQRIARLDMCRLVLEHRDTLRKFVRHSRASCVSDVNDYYHPAHGSAGCPACCLDSLYERDDVVININIQMTQVRGSD